MVLSDISLKDYSSLHVGGKGAIVDVTSVSELQEAISTATEKALTVHILGQGTNSYFGDDLSRFLFVLMKLRGISVEEKGEDVFLTIAAGEIWDDIVSLSVENGWWGIENLSHIPGTVGAAPVQNIGAYGEELSDVFESLVAFDITTQKEIIFSKQDCRFGYRDSIFKYEKGRYIILSMRIRLSKRRVPHLEYKPLDSLSPETTIAEVRELVIKTRAAKLPDWHRYPNAGSFFKNVIIDEEAASFLRPLYPDMPMIQSVEGYKVPTAWLIEHVAEMKGIREGDVGSWPAQPLVIVNYGEATADEIDAFASKIREKIHSKVGIVLEQEVNRIG